VVGAGCLSIDTNRYFVVLILITIISLYHSLLHACDPRLLDSAAEKLASQSTLIRSNFENSNPLTDFLREQGFVLEDSERRFWKRVSDGTIVKFGTHQEAADYQHHSGMGMTNEIQAVVRVVLIKGRAVHEISIFDFPDELIGIAARNPKQADRLRPVIYETIEKGSLKSIQHELVHVKQSRERAFGRYLLDLKLRSLQLEAELESEDRLSPRRTFMERELFQLKQARGGIKARAARFLEEIEAFSIEEEPVKLAFEAILKNRSEPAMLRQALNEAWLVLQGPLRPGRYSQLAIGPAEIEEAIAFVQDTWGVGPEGFEPSTKRL
jgi:hypothetical protein